MAERKKFRRVFATPSFLYSSEKRKGDMTSRIDRGKVARGGASKRTVPSRGATWLHERGLDSGSVLDFGCGYGMDADTFGWNKYDPYYGLHEFDDQQQYDTIVCTYVLSAVSETVAESIVERIFKHLKEGGTVYFVVPRNLPKEGKLSGYSRRPQSNVILCGTGIESVHLVEKEFEIYAATSPELRLSGFYEGRGGK